MLFSRVIFCALSSLAMLNMLPHETLLKRDDGVVAVVQDETMKELLTRQAAVSLLYFNVDAYRAAILGMKDADIDALIRKRRQDWAPNAVGHGLNWLYEAARHSLSLTAWASVSSLPGKPSLLDDHFEEILQLLVIITGEKRYQTMSLSSLLVLVMEGEAELRCEYLEGQKAARQYGDSSASLQFAAAVKRSEGYIRELGKALNSLGRPEYAHTAPYISLSRGVFITPQDSQLIKLLMTQQGTYITWKDGLVANWSLEDIPELKKRGNAIHILYFNGGQFLQDLQDMTPFQLERELTRRAVTEQQNIMQTNREHLDILWLEQHLLRRKAFAYSRAQNNGLAEMLESQIKEETFDLRKELSHSSAWRSKTELSGNGVFGTIKDVEEQLLKDARFLAMLSRLERDVNSEALYKRIADFKPLQP